MGAGGVTTEHKPQRERECVCGEINTRHCPVHGQDSKQHSSADEVRAVLDYLYHGTGAPGRSEQWQSGRFALQQLEEQLETALAALRKSQGHVPYFGRHTETTWCERCGPKAPWPCELTSDEARRALSEAS